MAEIVRTEVEEYAPIFNEDTGEYIDSCPYEKYTRGQNSVYTCRCISGRTMNNRQQFIQHFKTKAHTNWLKNLGKDENIKLIKELRVDNGIKTNKINLQARHLKRAISHSKMLENEIEVMKKSHSDIMDSKNKLIADLEENIRLLEESTGNSIVYSDLSDDNAVFPDDLSTIETNSNCSTELKKKN